MKQRTEPALYVPLLGALYAIAPLSIDMYLPSFSDIQASLNLEAGSVELSLSSYFLGMLVSLFAYGPLSDRFGRKPPLCFGLILYTISAFAISQADSLTALVGWRFAQGMGGCAGSVLVVAMVRDHYVGREAARIMSFIALIMGAAPIVAPVVGGMIAVHWGWRTIFYLLTAYGASCLVATLVFLDESLRVRSSAIHLSLVFKSYGQLLRDPRFMGYVMSQGCTAGAMFAYLAGSPFVIVELYQIPVEQFGYLFAINAMGYVAGSQLNRFMLKYFEPAAVLSKTILLPCIGGIVLMVNVAVLDAELWPILIGFFLVTTAVGMVNPNTSALAMAAISHNTGSAAAVLGGANFSMGMTGAALVSALHDGSAKPVAVVILAFGVCGLLSNRLLSNTAGRGYSSSQVARDD